MSLSNELISQFVKITNDKEEPKKETTVYGTIVERNGVLYTKLDGSELLTPIIRTTNVVPGERVTVMIKNHTATVTGNITSPSARAEEVIDKLDTNVASMTFANIDFSNISTATMAKFYASSGLIQNVVIGDATISGKLVGVTISGNLIEGGTVVADKLVIKGSDGLYYKLNTDGMAAEAEQTDYNSLNGNVIRAKSITATKIDVKDLVAFGATIGGFKISDKSIYSGVKNSVDNATRGTYLDNDGQISFGDANRFIKFYKDQNGKYRLDIAADSVTFDASNGGPVSGVNVGDAIKETHVEYAISDSSTLPPANGWSTTVPELVNGKYIWQRTFSTTVNGGNSVGKAICIDNAVGKDGEDAIFLQIISSNGHMFKNSALSTTLTVEIIVGGNRITSSSAMYTQFGSNAYLQWEQKKFGETVYTPISRTDPRLSDNGFIFTINSEDVKLQTVYNCTLNF